jgi:uncharacterized protein (TIGR01777 family)
MRNKVVIAGGTGFIGQYLQNRFEDDGYEVLIISRQNGHISWQDRAGINTALENAEVLINLAGKPINTRFSIQNKIDLIDSRVKTTETLGELMVQCQNPPKVWLNASGAHIYGTDDLIVHTEKDKPDNTFFPAIMAQKWEIAFNKFKLPQTRKVALRISIVLGKNGGVLQPFVNLTKLFLGGQQGSGLQKFSWIHLEDFYQIIQFVASHKNIEGPINLCSPEIVNNKELMSTLRKVLHRPFGIPAPSFGIKIGALLLGIESDLILKSLSVYPQKLIEAGYIFKYPKLEFALKNILK